MKKITLSYVMMLVVAALAMVSCSENDGTVDEFANWQKKNETYFSQLYSSTQELIAKGDPNWKIIRQWSLPDAGKTAHDDLSNYIIVHVLNSGTSTSGSPLYSDSVMVNYRGYLIPSPSYASGYLFDRSYSGEYNPQTIQPVKFAVNGVVDGFATALMHMSIGDRWEVYIPYQLGYGTQVQSSGSIPAYSTLIFDVGLAGFSHPKAPAGSAAKAVSWLTD